MILLLFLLSISQADALDYYVTPNGSCPLNGRSLYPCYNLHEFNSRLWSNKRLVRLHLLPGLHVIPSSHTLTSFNMTELEVSPLLDSEFGAITCQLQARLVFKDIKELTISSTNITSCTLEFSKYHGTSSVSILNILFLDNKRNYPVIINNINQVEIIYSEFHSNNGAISCANSSIIIHKSVFLGNHRQTANFGVLHFKLTHVALTDSGFSNNTASLGGALHSDSSIIDITNTVFLDNHARKFGGAIFSYKSRLTMTKCDFEHNSAEDSGGAVYLQEYIGGTPIGVHYHSFIADSNFISNHAGRSGGGVYFHNSYKILMEFIGGSSKFNSAGSGGFAYFHSSTIRFTDYFITSNRALVNGGAVFIDDSSITYYRSCNITHNIAQGNGGAMYVINSDMSLLNASIVDLSDNVAKSSSSKGGAIFFLDKYCVKNYGPNSKCLVRVGTHYNNKSHFIFKNNTASQGSVLYGGLLDRCEPADVITPLGTTMRLFKDISRYDDTIPLGITSEPLSVCFCRDGFQPDCSKKEFNARKIRGETLSIAVAVLDQDENPVPGFVRAGYSDVSAQLGKGEERREIGNECENLHYHVYAKESVATLVLKPEGPCRDSSLSVITINVTVLPCSVGFEQKKDRCICDRRLTKYFNISLCDIETNSIERKQLIWLRYDEDNLKIYRNCPFDYCKSTDDVISISNPDSQCANHRSGILCGSCRNNYSIVLGGSKCLQCTSSRYAFIWLTVLFAVAGVVLVTFLLICNITISAGTLNGLIFYANTLSISGLTSLNYCSIHPILSVFISWVNLDLGIETCFYSGMDAYYKTWLQFVFPLYIWLLVGAIIIASYYSSTAMKIFGRNSIAILATLFLLSYSKILQTIITVFTFTQVLEGRADDVTDQLTPYRVWTYDGNIDYLKGRHIPLFIIALLVLLILFLPYTLVLIFGQCIRSLPPKRGLRWIHSTAFISILDAYHAPYNKKHRYWTGLMLLTRCFLFLTFAANYKDTALLTNMYTLALVLTGILTVKTFATEIYKNIYMNLLEFCFLLNLGILSATLHYLDSRGKSDDSLCNGITVSISVSFFIFFGILAYHVYLQIRKLKYYKAFVQFLARKRNEATLHTQLVEERTTRKNNTAPNKTAMAELREALLESGERK